LGEEEGEEGGGEAEREEGMGRRGLEEEAYAGRLAEEGGREEGDCKAARRRSRGGTLEVGGRAGEEEGMIWKLQR